MKRAVSSDGKPKKRAFRKRWIVLGAVLVVVLGGVAWYMFAGTKKPITADRTLINQAVTAINKNDQQGLSQACDKIRSTFRHETSPEYLTILTINAIRNEQVSEASEYLQKLKALGEYTYVDYAPWKSRESVLASFEHDVAFLQKAQNFQGATPHTQDGDK